MKLLFTLDMKILEALIIVDDELVALQLQISLLDEFVDHARDGLARGSRHVRQILLQWKLIDLNTPFAEHADLVGKLKHNVGNSSRGIFEGKTFDLGVGFA